MNEKKEGIFKGALHLGVAAFVSKLLGALYRIPLTNLIGSFGLGLYQTVFPVYALLLDLSGAGAPSALSKIIASYDKTDKQAYAYNYLKSSVKLFALIGCFFSILMFIFSKSISKLQGNAMAWGGYVALSPAVLLVCIISCFRGYFQGFSDMKPTALSQITEQLVKLIAGLFFAYVFKKDVFFAVAGTTFAVTVSEAVALLQLYVVFQKKKKFYNINFIYNKQGSVDRIKNIIKNVVPVVITVTAIPFSNAVDSVIIVNLLKKYNENATSLYGIFSGAVNTVINLPVSICYGISVATLPSVCRAKTNKDKQNETVKSLLLTFAVSIPCAMICRSMSSFIINFLFGKLSYEEKNVAIDLLKLCSVNIIFLSVLQTQNSVFIGMGKLYAPLIGMSAGVILKILLEYFLISLPVYNIYGGAIGSIACYFSACLINFIIIIKFKVKDANKTACVGQCAD